MAYPEEVTKQSAELMTRIAADKIEQFGIALSRLSIVAATLSAGQLSTHMSLNTPETIVEKRLSSRGASIARAIGLIPRLGDVRLHALADDPSKYVLGWMQAKKDATIAEEIVMVDTVTGAAVLTKGSSYQYDPGNSLLLPTAMNRILYDTAEQNPDLLTRQSQPLTADAMSVYDMTGFMNATDRAHHFTYQHLL